MNQQHQELRVRDQIWYLESEGDVLPWHVHHHALQRCNENQTKGIRRHKIQSAHKWVSRVEPAIPAVFHWRSPEEIAARQCTILCLLKISVQPLFCKAGGSAMRILVKVKNFCKEFPNKT
jgi:hypothetical protein